MAIVKNSRQQELPLRVSVSDDVNDRELLLKELRERVKHRAATSKGTLCPVCGRLVKVYRRKLHAEMARFLIRLVNRYKIYPRYYTTREIFGKDNKAVTDGVYLVHWGLIEKASSINEAQAPTGSYRPTDKGLRFSHNLEYVPTHVHLLGGKVVGWSDRTTTIKQALGDKFNYVELMQS